MFLCKSSYTEVQCIVSWCDGHIHILNATKTKEMVLDPRGVVDHKPVSVKGQVVKQVTQFKYFGITLDCKLSCGVCLLKDQSLICVD